MYIIWMVDSRCKCFYCIYSTVISIYESLSIHSTLQKKTAKNVNATTNKYTWYSVSFGDEEIGGKKRQNLLL